MLTDEQKWAICKEIKCSAYIEGADACEEDQDCCSVHLQAQEQQTFVELVEWLEGRQLLRHDIEYWGVGRTRNNTCRKTCLSCYLRQMAKLVKASMPKV